MMDRAAVERWAEEYRRAWEAADADAAAALFSEGARYYSDPFKDPHVGRTGVHEYWSRVTAEQAGTSVAMGNVVLDGVTAAVEWWASWTENGGRVTLPGVLILTFDDTGACDLLRENYNFAMEPLGRFEGWGVVQPGDTEKTREMAVAWAAGYARAWRAGNIEAAAALYAPYCIYRSSPLRPARLGRAGVLEYTRWAFGSESDREVHMASPVVEGGTAVVQWWCSMIQEGEPGALSGCSLLAFDSSGLVATERDYFNTTAGRRGPHSDWR
jgi:hypothetical protein